MRSAFIPTRLRAPAVNRIEQAAVQPRVPWGYTPPGVIDFKGQRPLGVTGRFTQNTPQRLTAGRSLRPLNF